MTRSLLVLAALLPACNRGGEDTGPTLDTGWFTDRTDTGGCVDQVVEVTPGDGEDAWYWRRAPRVDTSSTLLEAYEVRLLDADGAEVPVTAHWSGQGFDVGFTGGLQPNTEHTLEVTDCDGTERVRFRTSAYGTPLDADAASINGGTYVFDMSKADWVEPRGFSAIIALYFSRPVLIGVQWADDTMIDLLGSLGIQRDIGDIVQDRREPSWDFPVADFTEAPYFEAMADEVRFEYDGVAIDVYDFRLSATVSADGQKLGGARVSGLGDTRNMGELVGQKGDKEALCRLAATWNVPCEPCPDGQSYCMKMTALDAEGALVPGLTLQPVE